MNSPAPLELLHVHLLAAYFAKQLEADAEITAELLFNMLVAGGRPPAEPGDLVVIG